MAAAAAPGARRSSSLASTRKTALGSPVCERPEATRRSPRLHSQKENVPASPAASPAVSPRPPARPPGSPCPPPLSPHPPGSPAPPPAALPPPRVRRSYSRLEASTPLGRAPAPRGPPVSPLSLDVPLVPVPPVPTAATDLPGIGLGPERRRKRKVAPIDQGELEAWAARMNAQFEEAERFDLVVE